MKYPSLKITAKGIRHYKINSLNGFLLSYY